MIRCECVGAFLGIVSRENAVLAPFASSNVNAATLDKVSSKAYARSFVVECPDAEALSSNLSNGQSLLVATVRGCCEQEQVALAILGEALQELETLLTTWWVPTQA